MGDSGYYGRGRGSYDSPEKPYSSFPSDRYADLDRGGPDSGDTGFGYQGPLPSSMPPSRDSWRTDPPRSGPTEWRERSPHGRSDRYADSYGSSDWGRGRGRGRGKPVHNRGSRWDGLFDNEKKPEFFKKVDGEDKKDEDNNSNDGKSENGDRVVKEDNEINEEFGEEKNESDDEESGSTKNEFLNTNGKDGDDEEDNDNEDSGNHGGVRILKKASFEQIHGFRGRPPLHRGRGRGSFGGAPRVRPYEGPSWYEVYKASVSKIKTEANSTSGVPHADHPPRDHITESSAHRRMEEFEKFKADNGDIDPNQFLETLTDPEERDTWRTILELVGDKSSEMEAGPPPPKRGLLGRPPGGSDGLALPPQHDLDADHRYGFFREEKPSVTPKIVPSGYMDIVTADKRMASAIPEPMAPPRTGLLGAQPQNRDRPHDHYPLGPPGPGHLRDSEGGLNYPPRDHYPPVIGRDRDPYDPRPPYSPGRDSARRPPEPYPPSSHHLPREEYPPHGRPVDYPPRGPHPDVYPPLGPPADAYPPRGPPDGYAPRDGYPPRGSEAYPPRGPPDAYPPRGPEAYPPRGPPDAYPPRDVYPPRGPPADAYPSRGPPEPYPPRGGPSYPDRSLPFSSPLDDRRDGPSGPAGYGERRGYGRPPSPGGGPRGPSYPGPPVDAYPRSARPLSPPPLDPYGRGGYPPEHGRNPHGDFEYRGGGPPRQDAYPPRDEYSRGSLLDRPPLYDDRPRYDAPWR